MKIQNVLYLSYDGNGVPSVKDTSGPRDPGTLLTANMLNPPLQEMHTVLSRNGYDPEQSNDQLYQLLRSKMTIAQAVKGSGNSKSGQLTSSGSGMTDSASRTIDSIMSRNRSMWDSSLLGFENVVNERIDRINSVMTEMSTAFTGGIFPSAKDTPQCPACDGGVYDRKNHWQLGYAIQGQFLPDLGGYFLRGWSATGGVNRCFVARPDSIYFGIEQGQSLGSFTNHHDTSSHIEEGSNSWATATGCFQETGIGAPRWVYDNGGKKSKDSDMREDQCVGLNMGLSGNIRTSTESRPKSVSFKWVMYGGLRYDPDFTPQQTNPYNTRVPVNLTPLSLTPTGYISGNGMDSGSFGSPNILVHYSYNTAMVPVSQSGLVGSSPVHFDPPVLRNSPTGAPISAGNDNGPNFQFSFDQPPTADGEPIPYYVNLMADDYNGDDNAPRHDPLISCLEVGTGAVTITPQAMSWLLTVLQIPSSQSSVHTVEVSVKASGSSGVGVTRLRLVLYMNQPYLSQISYESTEGFTPTACPFTISYNGQTESIAGAADYSFYLPANLKYVWIRYATSAGGTNTSSYYTSAYVQDSIVNVSRFSTRLMSITLPPIVVDSPGTRADSAMITLDGTTLFNIQGGGSAQGVGPEPRVIWSVDDGHSHAGVLNQANGAPNNWGNVGNEGGVQLTFLFDDSLLPAGSSPVSP